MIDPTAAEVEAAREWLCGFDGAEAGGDPLTLDFGLDHVAKTLAAYATHASTAAPPWHSRSEMRRMAHQTPQALIAEIDRLTVLAESYRDSKLGYRDRMLEHGETIGRLNAERDAMRAGIRAGVEAVRDACADLVNAARVACPLPSDRAVDDVLDDRVSALRNMGVGALVAAFNAAQEKP